MPQRKTLVVEGMSCNGCEQNVESALSKLDTVNRVEADHDRDEVEVVVDDTVEETDLTTTIQQAGYDVPNEESEGEEESDAEADD